MAAPDTSLIANYVGGVIVESNILRLIEGIGCLLQAITSEQRDREVNTITRLHRASSEIAADLATHRILLAQCRDR